ncbi:UDP-sugar pyrophosphorylase-like protein [Drosera capensis]
MEGVKNSASTSPTTHLRKQRTQLSVVIIISSYPRPLTLPRHSHSLTARSPTPLIHMGTSTTPDSAADRLADLDIGDAEWAASVPNLRSNLALLSADHVKLGEMLVEMGQSHVFEHWPELGVDDEEKRGFFDQIARLNASYPGGLSSYIKNARELLADSKAGKNPFDGFTPSVPSGENLTFADDDFIKFEQAGIEEAQHAAFVLVAGGLGERLGYNGIKVALPLETSTGTCFLQHYIESILALQDASYRKTEGNHKRDLPFAIMTSDDTHARTLSLLESNSYFGMKPSQVTLIKQEKVACLEDNDARLALDPKNKYRIQTKPHGHGDVHSLLYSSGLLKKWYVHHLAAAQNTRQDAGIRWVLFFQDTNGLLFNAIPAALGVSSMKEYHVNSLAVPRKAKEAIGGIAKLTHADGRTMVINVEYNQLDPLLRATINPEGDVNAETGFSPFPGNINQLILELGPYIEELNKTGGAIKEFVNPKYKDASKTSFKSSTRLECMMQDYPKTLPPTARVGFTVMDAWLAYAPVKNNPEDAAKVPKGNPYHSATSGEMAIYRAHSLILRKAGVVVDDPVQAVFNGQEVELWPRITWRPKWAQTFSDVKAKISGNSSISQRSTLVIDGRNVFVEDLCVDGALIVNSIDDAVVKVGGRIQNKGWVLQNVDYKDTSEHEEIRIRGFKINKVEQLEGKYGEPGKYSLRA